MHALVCILASQIALACAFDASALLPCFKEDRSVKECGLRSATRSSPTPPTPLPEAAELRREESAAWEGGAEVPALVVDRAALALYECRCAGCSACPVRWLA